MASLLDERCDHLLLPRPWLEIQWPRVGDGPSRKIGLYVRGDAMVGGRMIRLSYWHKVVNVKSKTEIGV